MKLIRLDYSGRWGVSCNGYSQALRLACKATPGMAWNRPYSNMWQGYSDACMLVAQKLRESHIRIDTSEFDSQIYSTPYNHIEKGLRQYQIEGVQFLLANGREGCILADDMGVGKTPQAIAALRAMRAKAIIVCPNFVRGVWRRHLADWWPKATVSELRGTTAKTFFGDLSADVVILNYDIAYAWVRQLSANGRNAVVFDECQYLQSTRAQRSQACLAIANTCAVRIGLSGTPMTNRPRDLWNVVETLSPGRFGGFMSYAIRYCGAYKEEVAKNKIVWKTEGNSNLEELNSRLKHFMLRRTKQDVGMQLPPLTRQIVEVDVARKYAEMPDEINKHAIRRSLDLAADGKLPAVVEMLQSHVESGNTVILFVHRQAIAEAISATLTADGIFSPVIHGGIALEERERRIEQAKQTPGSVLCCTIYAVAEGIDFTFASVGVVGELIYDPTKLAQACARLYRFGQQNPVLLQFVVAANTADELVRDVVLDKLAVLDSVVGDTGDGLHKALAGSLPSEDEVLESLAKRLERMS